MKDDYLIEKIKAIYVKAYWTGVLCGVLGTSLGCILGFVIKIYFLS